MMMRPPIRLARALVPGGGPFSPVAEFARIPTQLVSQHGAVGALCGSGIRKNSDATRFPTRNSCEFRYGW